MDDRFLFGEAANTELVAEVVLDAADAPDDAPRRSSARPDGLASTTSGPAAAAAAAAAATARAGPAGGTGPHGKKGPAEIRPLVGIVLAVMSSAGHQLLFAYPPPTEMLADESKVSHFGHSAEMLATMLCPSSLAGQQFELEVDGLCFIGRPTAILHGLAPSTDLFNIVLVLDAAVALVAPRLVDAYRAHVTKLNTALQYEQSRCEFLAAELAIMSAIRERAKDDERHWLAELASAVAAASSASSQASDAMPLAEAVAGLGQTVAATTATTRQLDAMRGLLDCTVALARRLVNESELALLLARLWEQSAADGLVMLSPTLHRSDGLERRRNGQHLARVTAAMMAATRVADEYFAEGDIDALALAGVAWLPSSYVTTAVALAEPLAAHAALFADHQRQRRVVDSPGPAASASGAFGLGAAASSSGSLAGGAPSETPGAAVPAGRRRAAELTARRGLRLELNGWLDLNLSLGAQSEFPPLRPYHTLLLVDNATCVLARLPEDAAPALRALISLATPTRTLDELAAETGLALRYVFQLAAHLVHWGWAKIMNAITAKSTFVTVRGVALASLVPADRATGSTAPIQHLAQLLVPFQQPLCIERHVRQQTGRAAPRSAARDADFVTSLVWLLTHGFVVEVHQYPLLLVPSSPRARSPEPESYDARGASDPHASRAQPVRARASPTQARVSRAQLGSAPHDADPNAHQLGELDANEHAWITNSTASIDAKNTLFAIAPLCRGRHHIDEIMWREGLTRDSVLALVRAFSDVLVLVHK